MTETFASTSIRCIENEAERTLAVMRQICRVSSQLIGAESKSTLESISTIRPPIVLTKWVRHMSQRRALRRHFTKGMLYCCPAESTTGRQRPKPCEVSSENFLYEILENSCLLWSYPGLRLIQPRRHPVLRLGPKGTH